MNGMQELETKSQKVAARAAYSDERGMDGGDGCLIVLRSPTKGPSAAAHRPRADAERGDF